MDEREEPPEELEQPEQAPEQTPEEAREAATAFVVEQMREGADEETIVVRLIERGMGKDEAREVVTTVYPEVMRAAEAELFEPRALLPAVLAALGAAVAGGVVWGLIIRMTEYEAGIVAIGIGLLAGYAVVLATGGRKGRPLQVIAVASSLVGIVVGKYLGYVWVFQDLVREEIGDEEADSISIFDTEMVRIFVEDARQIFGGFDLLWVALAAYWAWRIPRPLGIRVRRSPISGL